MHLHPRPNINFPYCVWCSYVDLAIFNYQQKERKNGIKRGNHSKFTRHLRAMTYTQFLQAVPNLSSMPNVHPHDFLPADCGLGNFRGAVCSVRNLERRVSRYGTRNTCACRGVRDYRSLPPFEAFYRGSWGCMRMHGINT